MNDIITRFYVHGMDSDECAGPISEALRQVSGVADVQLDLAQGVASVTGDIDPQAVCHVLAQAGYPAVVKSGL